VKNITKKVTNKITSAVTGAYVLFTTSAYAAKIKKPSFVKESTVEQLDKAGEVVQGWLLAFVGIVMVLYAIYVGYLFMTGETEKGVAAGKNLLVGAILTSVLGGIAFAVIAFFA